MENVCRVCNLCESGKKLSNHIKKCHGLSSLEYTVKYIYDGIRPVCQKCGDETRYSSFKFMKYCILHSSIAESEAGKVGGRAEAWNKGKTANIDTRIVRLTGESNPFWGRHHSEVTKKQISLKKKISKDELTKRVSQRSNEFSMITPIDEYQSRQGQYLDFSCNVCGNNNKKTLQSFERGGLCNDCFPNTSSRAEIEIEAWLKSCGVSVTRSDRTVIAPKELDITVHEKQFAIEYDGLYWHSELASNNIERSYHKDKTINCLAKGWKLMHIFSDDWHIRQDIVKSMLLHKMGVSQKKIHARSCTVTEIGRDDRRSFFDKNHLSGDVSARKAWALVDSDNQLVAAISVRIPIQKKWKDRIEIARFAVKGGKHVPGALSRLLSKVKEFSKEEAKIGLISYADRRHGEGKCYQSVGFTLSGDTGLDYWYTDGRKRFDRFTFRATDSMTEKQRAQEANVGKIWGCGNNVWLFDY